MTEPNILTQGKLYELVFDMPLPLFVNTSITFYIQPGDVVMYIDRTEQTGCSDYIFVELRLGFLDVFGYSYFNRFKNEPFQVDSYFRRVIDPKIGVQSK